VGFLCTHLPTACLEAGKHQGSHAISFGAERKDIKKEKSKGKAEFDWSAEK